MEARGNRVRHLSFPLRRIEGINTESTSLWTETNKKKKHMKSFPKVSRSRNNVVVLSTSVTMNVKMSNHWRGSRVWAKRHLTSGLGSWVTRTSSKDKIRGKDRSQRNVTPISLGTKALRTSFHRLYKVQIGDTTVYRLRGSYRDSILVTLSL